MKVSEKVIDVSSTIQVPTSPKTDFFKWWLIFLRPLHKLTDREIDLATAFLKKRYELSKDITSDDLLDKIVLNEDYKREVREEVGVTLTHFQVIMGKLRNNGFIKDNKINPKFIPRIKKENGMFILLVYFDFSHPIKIDKLSKKEKEEPKKEVKHSKRGRKKKVDIVKEPEPEPKHNEEEEFLPDAGDLSFGDSDGVELDDQEFGVRDESTEETGGKSME